jgi:peptide/nickel transport system substrate-binding protein
MRRLWRTGTWAVAACAALGVAACGGSSGGGGGGGGGSSSGGKEGGTITIASGTAPQSADNQGDFTTQGTELYSVVNMPLLTFRRGVEGDAGAQIQPGLAQSLPKTSNGGKTYTFQLRKNLHYSDGRPIKASDFKFSIKRALKINWAAKSFLTGFIQGAEDFDSGKASDISGITTDDKTGKITVTLSQPFGAIVDILALAGTAPVPPDTPMKPQNSTGTIGDGPYKWGQISPGRSYQLVKNTKFDVPGQPKGHAQTINYKVNSNVLANAQQVLQNQADVFDPGDTLPSSILSQVQSQASDRYKAVPTNSTFYFFLGINQKPFNNLKARQAVLTALDLRALSRLDSGFLEEDCHLIPLGITGHSQPSNCPFHSPTAPGDVNKAKQMVQQSGMAGEKVTVWGENRSPRKQYVDYLTDVLNKIGFKASEKIINDQVYFQTVGNQKTKPQIGFADWIQDFPNPWDFMQLMTTAAIQPQNSSNYGYVSDKHIDQMVDKLAQVPANNVQSVADQWAALDDYAVKQGYYAAYGHEKFPKFYSNRLNFNAGVMSVEYQTDMTSLQLNSGT